MDNVCNFILRYRLLKYFFIKIEEKENLGRI